MAKATLEVCERGDYVKPNGECVSIAAALEAARAGTEPHELGTALRPLPATKQTAISVTHESTIEAIVRLAPTGAHVACLNFASAKNPGGGFLGGAQAQEESLARSSGLYPCLLTQRGHYERNRDGSTPIYFDTAIWSPHVPFFRDDDGSWLVAPVLASVITCAAPNASALRQQQRFDAAVVEAALRKRAAFVLAIAAHRGVERLILGAWGAGVFGNDPAMVADAFGKLLEGDYKNVFVEVVFAVMGGPGGNNFDAFATRFT
ncbi:MAG: TIGR02452 family protein [Deltaproteobacteria bacterium]|nr:TIGR02452 family protein [Deltaproteobacteria bacterium]